MMLGTIPVNIAGFAVILAGAGLAYAILVRRLGTRVGVRFIPMIVLIAIFVSITHLPWPGLEWDGCGDPTLRPLFKPFRFIDAIERRWDSGLPVATWVAEFTISATALNLHACIAIGAALALCICRASVGVLIGVVMTAAIETSQFTGLFGFAHCPWRQFDVDDLILNVTGVAIGFFIARRLGVRCRPVSGPAQ